MRKVFMRMAFGIIAALLAVVSAWAGPQELSWDQSAGATSYGIEQSVDNGATWTAVIPTAGPTCATTAPLRCTATVTAPASGLALYRVWAANAVGRTTRFSAGAWVCESCAPPAAVQQTGVR